MIFVDSNIPIYLVGAPHPHKVDAQRLLELLVSRDERLVTDAEVLQEILHRYSALGRIDAIQPAFDALFGVIDEVFPMERGDAERAKSILAGAPQQISARDAIHIAIMKRRDICEILTFDAGFDNQPGISRIRE
jgi:predicted nucleic acid-binding protein